MNKAITSAEYAALITWLKQAREQQGLTMRELAEKLEEPHTFVQKVEALQRRLDVYEFSLYCKALNLKPINGMVFFQ